MLTMCTCRKQVFLFHGGSDSSSVTMISTRVTADGKAKPDTLLLNRDLSSEGHIYIVWDTIIRCGRELNLEIEINDTIVSSLRFMNKRKVALRIENISSGSQSGVRYVFLD